MHAKRYRAYMCTTRVFEARIHLLRVIRIRVFGNSGFDKDTHFFLCDAGHTAMVIPPVLKGGPICKGIHKFCCCEQRCALPCDEEVPCMFGACFVICFEDWKWKFSVFENRAPELQSSRGGSKGGGPVVTEMQR